MEKLYKELKKAGFAPEWDEEDGFRTGDILVITEAAEFNINKSAAPGFYGVQRSEPFSENEFYICDGVEKVIDLIKQEAR